MKALEARRFFQQLNIQQKRRFFVGLFYGGMCFFVFWGGLEKDLVRLVPPSRRFGGGKIFF